MNATAGPHPPLIAYGVPALRSGTDNLCRRELRDLTAALCSVLHGAPVATGCRACAELAGS